MARAPRLFPGHKVDLGDARLLPALEAAIAAPNTPRETAEQILGALRALAEPST